MSIEEAINNLVDAIDANTKAILSVSAAPAKEPAAPKTEKTAPEKKAAAKKKTAKKKAAAKPAVSKEAITELMKSIRDHENGGRDMVIELLEEMGAQKLSDIDAADYEAFIGLLKEKEAELKTAPGNTSEEDDDPLA